MIKKRAKRHWTGLGAAILVGLMAAPASVLAWSTENVDHNGKPFAQLQFMDEGDRLGSDENRWFFYSIASNPRYSLPESLKKATQTNTAYWADILGPKLTNRNPLQIFVTTRTFYQNADAASGVIHSCIDLSPPDSYHYAYPIAQDVLANRGYPMLTKELAAMTPFPAGDYGYITLTIGQYLGANREGAEYGWWSDTETLLPTNEQATDYDSTIRHELAHALGIYLFNITVTQDEQQQSGIGHISGNVTKFDERVTQENAWNLHLVDQNGNRAKPGMWIVTSKQFQEIQSNNANAKTSDYFIVDRGNYAFFNGRCGRGSCQGIRKPKLRWFPHIVNDKNNLT